MAKKSLSSECKYCGKFFILSKSIDSLYCCRFCSLKKEKTICKICLKEFHNNAEKVTCSKKCLAKYIKSFVLKKNRTLFWKLLSKAFNSNSKIVKKTWGFEIHFSNNNNYCIKYLVYFKNAQSSFHFHNIKTELWYCLCGSFDCFLQSNNQKAQFKIRSGEKIEIKSKQKHQLKALANSIILEVSTRDFPEDSIKIN